MSGSGSNNYRSDASSMTEPVDMEARLGDDESNFFELIFKELQSC